MKLINAPIMRIFHLNINAPNRTAFVNEGKHNQSDISRQQFDLIRQDLEASRKRTHPKHIDPNEGLTGDYYHLVYAKNTFGHALYQTPPRKIKPIIPQTSADIFIPITGKA